MDFMLGCNYWDSRSGTDMWKNWDEKPVREDLRSLEACGVKHLRIFPNWRDFQPVDKYCGHARRMKGYFTPKGADCSAPDYVDMNMIRHFRRFCEIAAEYDMEITVSVVTGWMSGRLFFPPALMNKELLTDTESLVLINRFVTKLVTEIKDIKNIVMWDLGNEINCMERVPDCNYAYVWMAMVRNAIRAADPTRPIASGMHGLSYNEGGEWPIKHQGELMDLVTTHPYPSPTIHNDIEPANRLRSTMVPTAQSEFYAGLSGKPCIMQEQGTFSPCTADPEAQADFARVNILSAYANNLSGYLWWCGMEHKRLTEPPYTWSMLERSLGMVYEDRSPKPIGLEFKRISDALAKLPTLPPKRTDAVCILTDNDIQDKATATYVMAKQAGINVRFIEAGDAVPESDIYILPSCRTDTFLKSDEYEEILGRAYNGATVYFSVTSVHLCDFEQYFGLRSIGMARMRKSHTAHFPFGDIEYSSEKEIICESVGAEVLATNEEGNVVFSKNKYGKGYVYLLNFDLELMAATTYDIYNKKPSISGIYKLIDKVSEKASEYVITTEDSRVGITECPTEDGFIVTVINYSDEDIDFSYTLKDGYKTEALYGDLEHIPHCDAAFVKVTRK